MKKAQQHSPMVISVGSGKGGVGKTLSIVNLAEVATQMGYKVLILDGDFGLANVDILFGLQGKYNLSDVLEGFASLDEIILETTSGIKIIPSGSGLTSLQNLTYVQKQFILEQIRVLDFTFDLLLIDTGAGIGENVLHLNSISERRIIVTTPEPHAMTDAYALIKVLKEEKAVSEFDLLINMAGSAREAAQVAQRLATTAETFLGLRPHYLGYVPYDPALSRVILSQSASKAQGAKTLAEQAWQKLGWAYFRELSSTRVAGPELFWQRYLTGLDRGSVAVIATP